MPVLISFSDHSDYSDQASLFTAVMNACYTVGDMDSILCLGDQLRAQNLTPDDAAYHLMVTSHICNSVSAAARTVEVVAFTSRYKARWPEKKA